MTTNLLQNSKDGVSTEANGLAIGETDASIFTCPVCSRPLAEGTYKCPGCGTRLIMGVRLKRAGAILALGVVVGILIGGATTAAIITVSVKGPVSATTPVASAAPATVPTAAPPLVAPPEFAAPAAAVSALSGTAVVNGRIAVDAATLVSTLGRSNATSIELARALRSLAADAALGIDLAGRLAPWTEAADVRTGLDDFYRAMAQEARTGLRSSLNDPGAYRKAGAAMLPVLRTMASVDTQSRGLADSIGLELPPVVLPAS
jgi:predicted lysophospholipase L1 biosynthesis ABC-type transport system permease subunit